MKEANKDYAHEEFLLERCHKKETAAVQEFVAVYGEDLYGFLRASLGLKAELAYSVLTDSIVECLRAGSGMDRNESVRVTMTRALLNGIRKNIKDTRSEGPLAGLQPRLAVLFAGLSRLSWNERVLLLLRDQMGFSLEEIRGILSEPEQKIRGQLQTVRLHFREVLKELMKGKRTLKS